MSDSSPNPNNRVTLLTTRKNALLLTAFAAVCTLFVALTHLLTKPVIEQQKQQNVLNKLTQVLDDNKFNNNPLFNCTEVTDTALSGDNNPITVYRATLDDTPYAIVFQTQTNNGYNGKITMMVALDQSGTVQGVRTLEHQETPGLGDKIELSKSDWILAFAGKEVESEKDPQWFIKKDGGQFDQFTGATITPRAMVNQLRTSIYQATLSFDAIFSAPNECEVASEPQAKGGLSADIELDQDANSEVAN